MTKEQDEFIKQYLNKNKKSNIGAGILTVIIMVGLVALAAWIIQTAFGCFGYDFTLWQSFIIGTAASIMFGGRRY